MHPLRRLSHAWIGLRVFGVVVLCGGCATGIDHRISEGENLFRIGKAYGIPYPELARVNGIAPPYKIRAGDTIFVPGAKRQLPVVLITPRAVDARPPASTRKPRPKSGATATARPTGTKSAAGNPSAKVAPKVAPTRSGRFRWPAQGTITSGFGPRRRGHHDGIDIKAPEGNPIHCVADGKVIFADRLSGYGNVIIVEHAGGFTTVYAHNKENLVRKGETLPGGAKIALVGHTGRASAPHLHFEVRKDNVARDPRHYLPKR